jgi:hypothetical protein
VIALELAIAVEIEIERKLAISGDFYDGSVLGRV